MPDPAASTSHDLRCRAVEGWEHLPAGVTHLDCVGVGVDRVERVPVLTRDRERRTNVRHGSDGRERRVRAATSPARGDEGGRVAWSGKSLPLFYDRLVKTRVVVLRAGFGGLELAADVNRDGA